MKVKLALPALSQLNFCCKKLTSVCRSYFSLLSAECGVVGGSLGGPPLSVIHLLIPHNQTFIYLANTNQNEEYSVALKGKQHLN